MAARAHTIVQELIDLDPSFETHRAALEKNVAALLATKPETRFSGTFQSSLLHRLHEELAIDSSTSFSLFTMMHKFLYAGGGAVLGAFLAFVVIHNLPEFDNDVFVPADKDSGLQAVRMMNESHAVDMAQNMPSIAPMPAMDPTMNSRPQSGGGGGRAGGGGGAPMEGMAYREEMMGTDAKMIAPYPDYQPVAVDYVYEGDIALPKDNVQVLRRVLPKMSDDGSVLEGTFATKLFNISKVAGLKMQSVSLIQDGSKEPYFVNVDFQNGSVSINKNIDYNSRPESKCTDEACFARYRLKMSDMPSDASVVAIADAFMKSFNVATDSLGEPVMQDDWRYWYESAPDKSAYWFPEQLSVVYPYTYDGKPIYDEWGNAMGVNVTVDIREKAVTGVWGLQTMQFDSTSYAPAKDTSAVEKIVREGGRNMWRDPASKVFESKLKEPTEAYVQIYVWDQKNLNGETLYVPALAFPVESIPMEANTVKKFVLLPLAAEFVTSEEQKGYPVPRPMMMPTDDGVMEGAAG